MAGFLGLTNSPSNYYSGSQYMSDYGQTALNAYQPQQYQNYNQGAMGNAYSNAVNTQLSGQLTSGQQAAMNQQLQSGLQQTQANAYGMPMGAEQANLGQVVSQNALNAGNLATQNIAQGESSAMPYMNMGQQQNEFAANLGQQQTTEGANLAQNEAQFAGGLTSNAYQQAANNPGLLGGLIGAGTSFGLNQLFPGSNSTGGYNSNNQSGYNSNNQMGNPYLYGGSMSTSNPYSPNFYDPN